MDLNHANKNGVDQGALLEYYLDLEESFSSENGDNTFQLECSIASNVVKKEEYIYVEGTEYGGIIDSVKLDTQKGTLYFKGRTWRGILESKIISPETGSDFLVVSGDLNEALSSIIKSVNLTGLFAVPTEMSGITVSNFRFRYCDAYEGIIKMLSQNGAKLHIEWNKGRVVISAVPIVDFSQEKEISSDLFDFVIEETQHTVNHMIGLGKGELSARQVVHKYIGVDGNITDKQYYFGNDEIMMKYDYPNCESLEELEEKTAEKLLQEAVDSKVKITAYDLQADIGDKFTATDVVSGLSVTQYVVNKIITIRNGTIKINYKVGDIL